MNINVKSTKVIKTGTNDYGEWKLVKIVTDEDVEYTTLAEEADQISPGVTLSISNMDEKEYKGKVQRSFKKFEYVQGAAKEPGEQPSTIDNEYWERKQAIDRSSIEGQSAMHDLTRLTIAGIKLEDCPELLRSAITEKIKGYTKQERITLIKD